MKDQPGELFHTVSLSSDKIALSGSTQLTLAIEGTAPLRVELPKNVEKLLTRESATVWHIKPHGDAKLISLAGGRERWEQTFRLSPFVPGEKVTVAFAPIHVTMGAELNPQDVTFPSKEVRVQSAIAEAKSEDARPVTSIEELPKLPAVHSESTVWWFLTCLGAVFATVLVFALIRKSRKKPEPVPPGDWAARELDKLERDHALERIAGLQAADRLAAILREFIERRHGLSASKHTTPELLGECVQAKWPAERIGALREVLERCDRAKYANEAPHLDEMLALIGRSREWLLAGGL